MGKMSTAHSLDGHRSSFSAFGATNCRIRARRGLLPGLLRVGGGPGKVSRGRGPLDGQGRRNRVTGGIGPRGYQGLRAGWLRLVPSSPTAPLFSCDYFCLLLYGYFLFLHEFDLPCMTLSVGTR